MAVNIPGISKNFPPINANGIISINTSMILKKLAINGFLNTLSIGTEIRYIP